MYIAEYNGMYHGVVFINFLNCTLENLIMYIVVYLVKCYKCMSHE